MKTGMSYYELLDVEKNATTAEIKKAYFKAVRKYPPERFPEEFKKIKEAYDTLSDPVSRQEYDDISSIDKKAVKYYKLGVEAYDNDDYKEAIYYLKNAAHLSPQTGYIRNLLGLAYMEEHKYKKAAEIFKKLVEEYPEKSSYYNNLGFAHLDRNAHRMARAAFEKAVSLDKTEMNSWMGLQECCFRQKDYTAAREALMNCVRYCGENVSIYMSAIRVDAAAKNMENLKADIESLKNMKIDSDEERENLSYALAMTAYTLMDEGLAELALPVLEQAMVMNPGDGPIKMLYDEAMEAREYIGPFKKLREDPNVPEILIDLFEKRIFRYTYFLNQGTEEDIEEQIIADAAKYIESIDYVRMNYPVIYKLKGTFLNKLLNNRIYSPVKPDSDSGYIEDDNAPGTLIRVDKIGRNDPCPCGSGKKFKKCCMNK